MTFAPVQGIQAKIARNLHAHYVCSADTSDRNENETRVKVYRGMASSDVEDEYHGGMAEWKTAEGVSTDVAYRENEDQIVADIVGGLRSGLTYGGAITIRELQRKLDYIHISAAAKMESMPHRLF